MTATPTCPSFALIEAHIDRVARRLREAPVQDIVLVRLIKALSAQFGAHLGRKVRPAGLNEVAFRTLMMLYAHDTGVHPAELSAASSETRTNMTRICDELARKGLLRRRPSVADRRRVVLELTRRGERLIEGLLPQVWGGLGRYLGALRAAEKRELERLLKKLLAAFEREAPP
jgi:MarR family transcriptional repressor of emrRAB